MVEELGVEPLLITLTGEEEAKKKMTPFIIFAVGVLAVILLTKKKRKG